MAPRRITRTHAEHLHTACTLSIIEICLSLEIQARWIAIIVSGLMLLREVGGIMWPNEAEIPQLVRVMKDGE